MSRRKIKIIVSNSLLTLNSPIPVILCLYYLNNTEPFLCFTPSPLFKGNYAKYYDWVKYSSKGFTAVTYLREHVKDKSVYSVDIAVWVRGKNIGKCTISLISDTECQFNVPSNLGSEGEKLDSTTTAVLESIKASSFSKFRKELKRYIKTSRNPEDIAWRLLEWIEENVEYDYDKGKSDTKDTLTALELLDKRRGICRDIAIFTAVSLLALGLDESYILCLEDNIDHMVGGVKIYGELFVLDQRLPVSEWNAYNKYLLAGINPHVTMFKLVRRKRNQIDLEITRPEQLENNKPFTADKKVLEELVCDVIKKLIRDKGWHLEPQLETISRYTNMAARMILKAPHIKDIKFEDNKPIHLTVLYHPVFHKQWVEKFAEYYLEMYRDDYDKHIKGSPAVWIDHRVDKDKGDILTLCAAENPVPKIKVTETYTAIKININVNEFPMKYDINNLDIMLYQRYKSHPIAGIAPPQTMYRSIETINADIWGYAYGVLIVEVRLSKIKQLLSRHDPRQDYLLIVFHKRMPIFAYRLKFNKTIFNRQY